MTGRLLVLACAIGCSASRGDALGPTRWAASSPDPGPAPVVIAVDAAGNVVSAVGDWLGAHAARDGTPIWEMTLPGQQIDRLAVGRDGTAIVAGTFGLASFDASGIMQWNQTLPDGVTWTDLAIAADGSIDVVGYRDLTTLVTAAFAADGTPRWTRPFPGARNATSTFRIAATADGLVAIVGKTDDTTAFGLPAQLPSELLAYLTADGLYEGAHVLPWDSCDALAADRTSGIVATFATTVASYDRYGLPRWDTTSQTSEALDALAVTSDGNVVTAGFAAFEAYAPSGAALDVLPFPRTDVISIQALAAMPDRAIAFAARTTGEVNFGTGPVNGVVIGVLDPPR